MLLFCLSWSGFASTGVLRRLSRSLSSSRRTRASIAPGPTDCSVATSMVISSSMVASCSFISPEWRKDDGPCGEPTLARRASGQIALHVHREKKWTDATVCSRPQRRCVAPHLHDRDNGVGSVWVPSLPANLQNSFGGTAQTSFLTRPFLPGEH